MKKNLLMTSAVVALAGAISQGATAAVVSLSASPAQNVPDGSAVGLVSTILSAERGYVASVSVTLETVGGWNGDLYVYLEHAGVISVLMNRIGRTASSLAGASSSGVSVSFTDSASIDIHSALVSASGPLIGRFQPDARLIDPYVATSASPRTNFLSNFYELPAAGEWTLFVADVASGDTTVLSNWGLQIVTVPEPSSALLFALAALGTTKRRRM